MPGLFNFGKKKKKEEETPAQDQASSASMTQSSDETPPPAASSDAPAADPADAKTVADAQSEEPQAEAPQEGATQGVSVEKKTDEAGNTTTTATTTTTQPSGEQTSDTTTATAPPTPPDQAKAPADQKDSAFEKRAGMDILSRLTQRSNKALVAGVGKAKELQVQFVDTEHILWGLIQDAGIYQLFSEMKVTPTDVVQAVEKQFKKGKSAESPKFSPRVKKVLEISFSEARGLGYEFISPEHILAGLVKENEGVAAQVLKQFGITEEKLKGKVSGKKDKKDEPKSATSEFALDLTQQAREGKLDPVVARSKEIERIMHILSRRTKNNPVLIGDAGVGKTAVVEGLAQRIVSGNVPDTLKNRRILSLDLTSLLAGASHRGEFEKRFKQLLEEVKASKGQTVLFIDEIHSMVGAGGSGGTMDASNILKPSLARGEVQTIGATTVTEYRTYIEKDRALERRFQQVLIQEPSQDKALLMIRALKDKYEAFHKVSITDDAMRAAVRLSARYVGDRSLPDKAVDLIDEAASLVKLPAISLPEEIQAQEEKLKRLTAEKDEAIALNNQIRERTIEREITKVVKELEDNKKEYEAKKGQTTSSITPEIIQEVVSDWTGIPISKLTESETEKLINLEDVIHKKLIDQEHAVSAVSEAVRRGRAGLKTRKRPIGSFIFMGPTGVGKTELAKVLAEELFGSKDMMVRLDMTEYMEKHEVAKLIGAPPGYVGYEEGGQLTEAVRRLPYSVVLLDEIEKAHPDVFNILLQILDDGRLTDNKGRTITFKNTILICTSNLGSGKIQEIMMKGMEVGPAPEPDKKEERAVGTFTISPTGREIVSKEKEIWEKDENAADETKNERWTKRTLSDFFKGQKINVTEELKETYELPENGFDTHVVFPSGEEMVTYGHRTLTRKSTIAKEWDYSTLLDGYGSHTVSNAHPDKPDEQFPTGGWETHAVTPGEKEYISVGEQMWMRENLAVPMWKTMTKEEYLATTKPAESQGEVSGGAGSTPEGEASADGDLKDASELSNDAVLATNKKVGESETPQDVEVKSVDAKVDETPPMDAAASAAPTDITAVPPTNEGEKPSDVAPVATSPVEEEEEEKAQPVQDATPAAPPAPETPATPVAPVSPVEEEEEEEEEDKKEDTPAPDGQGEASPGDTPADKKPAAAPQEENQDAKPAASTPRKKQGSSLFRAGKVEDTGTGSSEDDEKYAEPTAGTWDTHLFTPDGKEIIVIGRRYWMRVEGGTWQPGKLYELLSGDNAPVIKDDADDAVSAADEKFQKLTEKLLEELRTFFRPELINRFDEVVVFRPLQAKHMMGIVELQLKELEKGLEEQEFGLEVTDIAKEELSIEGFDPVFGARPLRRTIQRLIENPISTMLIQGKLAAGDTIVIEYDHTTDEFVFNVTRPAPREPQPAEGTQPGVEGGQVGPDGQPVAVGPDGQPVSVDANGQPIQAGADGQPAAVGPDGQPMQVGPDGQPLAADQTGQPGQTTPPVATIPGEQQVPGSPDTAGAAVPPPAPGTPATPPVENQQPEQLDPLSAAMAGGDDTPPTDPTTPPAPQGQAMDLPTTGQAEVPEAAPIALGADGQVASAPAAPAAPATPAPVAPVEPLAPAAPPPPAAPVASGGQAMQQQS